MAHGPLKYQECGPSWKNFGDPWFTLHKQTSSMPFAFPRYGENQKTAFRTAIFALLKRKDFLERSKRKIAYPNLDLARRPVPRNTSMYLPLPPRGGLESVRDEVEDDAGDG